MNIFNNLRVYAGKWSVKETRAFTQEEIAYTTQDYEYFQ
nr:MAG TPA: Bombinin [Crassvirales sp.]